MVTVLFLVASIPISLGFLLDFPLDCPISLLRSGWPGDLGRNSWLRSGASGASTAELRRGSYPPNVAGEYNGPTGVDHYF
jgi:hypothetical protein